MSVLKFHEASKLNSSLLLDKKTALKLLKGNVLNISHIFSAYRWLSTTAIFLTKGVRMTELFKERVSLKLDSPFQAWRNHWLHRIPISTLNKENLSVFL